MVEFSVVFKCTEVNERPKIKKKDVDRNIEILIARFYVDSANKNKHFIHSEQLD